MNKLFATAAVTAALVGLAGTTQSQNKKTLAFVVNGASDFWKAAEAGVKKAQTELPNYTLVFKYPEQSSAARSPCSPPTATRPTASAWSISAPRTSMPASRPAS